MKQNLKKFKCEEFNYRMMTSLDFEEYLMAINNEQLIEFIKSSFKNNKPMPFHTLAMDLYNEYDYKTSLNPSRVKTALRTFLPKNLL